MRLERIPWNGPDAPTERTLAARLAADGFESFLWIDPPDADYSPHAHDHDESLWVIDGEIGSVACCHCSQCRRASGTAFATNASVRAEHFRLIAGRDLLTEYESSPGKFRAFCARCGSPILSRWTAHPDFVRIRLGTLDDDPGSRPLLHVWVGSKAPWFEITDELPRLQGGS